MGDSCHSPRTACLRRPSPRGPHAHHGHGYSLPLRLYHYHQHVTQAPTVVEANERCLLAFPAPPVAEEEDDDRCLVKTSIRLRLLRWATM